MKVVLYICLYFILFIKSQAILKNGNFMRLTTNGKLESVFMEFTTSRKMKCATSCQQNNKCLTFSRRALNTMWRCQLSDKEGFVSGTDSGTVYKHLHRGQFQLCFTQENILLVCWV